MAESLELPLSEPLTEDFKRGWRHFEFIAAAKEWSAEKQLVVILTLLRGKLIDEYTKLPDASKLTLVV